MILVWLLAIAIRVYGATTSAQPYDIGTFQAWGNHLLSVGPSHFFDKIWSDYLPLPILTFAIPTWIAQTLHLDFSLVFKLFHSFLELIIIFAISKFSRLPFYPITPLLLLSPALIGDTSFWGQVDTIPALLAITGSPLLFGLAVAYKPIMILVAPILWIRDIKQGHWLRLPLISSLVFFATAIPTGGLQFISHLFSRIFSQVDTYPFLTINAFNFWSLVPNLSWIPDSTSVLSISGRTFGLVLFLALSLFTLNHWRKSKWDAKFTFRVAGTILILFYTFATRMHERHLLFGLPFLALAIQYQSFLLIPFILYSLFFTLNLYGAFFWVNHAQTWPFDVSFISLISWGVTLTSLALATIWSWPSFLKTYLLKLKKNFFLFAILLIAILLRFINLSHPPTYIFDEVYHAFTAREYLHNHVEAWEWWTTPPKDVAFEWTHPGVAKYGMVAGMLLFGENSLGWRVGSATAGVISILGLYLLVLALTRNKITALIAAFLVSIEGLHIAQSRIAMNDIYMLAFLIWSLYAGVKSRWRGAAILFGLALASKWSAIYGLLPLAFIYLHESISLRHLFTSLRYLLIVIFVYVLTFTPFILAGHTWAQWWELHRQMWYYHTHLVATHAYQSTPMEWLFDVRPVWYWVDYGKNSLANIYALGNPLILWLGLAALVLQLKKFFRYPYLILNTSYLILTLPWVMSPRIMFFYHYLPSSVFLSVLLASWLSSLSPRTRIGILILCFFGFIFISPLIYGFPMSHVYWDTLFTIFPSWK